ncbi:FAD-binding oxidoreductase [Dactylosporangium vinaceum]|nr:FAD-binding oxidoreductase [Dactylosporangium vinaceum]
MQTLRPAAAGPHRAAPPVAVRPGDPRYEDLALRRRNERFAHRPDRFYLAWSTEQVVAAVQASVDAGRPVTVRSGGHSLENSVGEHAGGVIIDLAGMRNISFDATRRAFEVESGATLGEVFRMLYLNWGVTIPGGWCHSVCVGGHIQGGGYGALSRSLGSVVDHLYGVEVVVVDADGRARTVEATREIDDPNRDLWWAHTGGGGGNFGVVTRYWLRSPVDGDDPAMLLPKPPALQLTGGMMWSWADLPADRFSALMHNHARWHESNSAPGDRGTALHSTLMVTARGETDNPTDILLFAMLDGSEPDARAVLEGYFDAVGAGIGGNRFVTEPQPWLFAVVPPDVDADAQRGAEYARYKGKAGYLRRGFSDAQIATIHRYLTGEPRPEMELARLWLVSYGGQVNAVDAAATALAQRDSILKAVYTATWRDAADDETSLLWLRRFYSDVYADTGGVPVPGDISDGSYINYPDVDLADPAWNTSGVPWHDLYYKHNYPRLQHIKRRFDPHNVFRHTLSIVPEQSEEHR